MSDSGSDRLADYSRPEEEDYSLVDQVEGQDQEEQEEELHHHHRRREDHGDFHIVPSAFRDSDDHCPQHVVSNTSRKGKKEKPISFEVRLIHLDHHLEGVSLRHGHVVIDL